MILNEQERILYSHITDLAEISERKGVLRFSAFLNEREAKVAESAARDAGVRVVFYGGYNGAARTVCGFFAGRDEDCSLFPLSAVTFSYSRGELSHRDFLGSIMGLGLERDTIGDILTAEGYAVVFCLEQAAELICGLEKVGRIGVKSEPGVTRPLPDQKTRQMILTVSSARLDCIVSALCNISRDKSASLVKSGQVSADFSVCPDVSARVAENTVLSVRGYGRFRVSNFVGETRKGRLRITAEKYL